jgi:DNA-binding beta-propeller fold protein YncE
VSGLASSSSSSSSWPALRWQLNRPEGVAVGAGGYVYVADTRNDRVLGLVPVLLHNNNSTSFPYNISRKLSLSRTEGTDCGAGECCKTGECCKEAAPSGECCKHAGGCLPKNRPAFSVVILAGGEQGALDGAGAAAQFASPAGLALSLSASAQAELIICDSDNGLVRAAAQSRPKSKGRTGIARKEGVNARKEGVKWHVTTVKASKMPASPRGIAVHAASGDLLITDAKDSHLWVISGGRGGEGGGGWLGPLGFKLGVPRGVAVDSRGRIVVADYSGRVLRLSENRDAWTVLASRGDRPTVCSARQGEARQGEASLGAGRRWPVLKSPSGVAVDADDVIYVADAGAHVIFAIVQLDGAEVKSTLHLIAGDGVAGHVDGLGDSARFVEPYSLALSSDGRSLVVADRRACAIRLISLPPRPQRATEVPEEQASGTAPNPSQHSTNVSRTEHQMQADDSLKPDAGSRKYSL